MSTPRSFPYTRDARSKLKHLIVLVVLALSMISCGSQGRSAVAKSEINESDRAGLPVVTLPLVDFGQVTKPLYEEPSPQALGRAIPASPFIVRFEGRRHPDELHFSRMFYIRVRMKQGGFGVIASCRVKPVGRLDDEVLIYEGMCEKPKRDRGECFIEVSRGKSYLVRSAQIQK